MTTEYGPWQAGGTWTGSAVSPGYQYRQRLAWNNTNDTDNVFSGENDASMMGALNLVRAELDGATGSDIDPSARTWSTALNSIPPYASQLYAYTQFVANFHGDGTGSMEGPHVEEFGTFFAAGAGMAQAWSDFSAYALAHMPAGASGVDIDWTEAAFMGQFKSVDSAEVTVEMSTNAGSGSPQPAARGSCAVELFTVPTPDWYTSFAGLTKTSRLTRSFSDVAPGTGSPSDGTATFTVPASGMAANGSFCLVPEMTQGSVPGWSGFHWDPAAGYIMYITTDFTGVASATFTFTAPRYRYTTEAPDIPLGRMRILANPAGASLEDRWRFV